MMSGNTYVAGTLVRRQYSLAACLKGALQALFPSAAGLAGGGGMHLTSARIAVRLVTRIDCIYYAAMLGLKSDDLRIHIE
jgi:hypothetical protein